MEKQLLDCLLANIIGFGKQFFTQGQAVPEGEGQMAFFDILAEKMGGEGGMVFMPAAATGTFKDVKADGTGEDSKEDHCPVGACLDHKDGRLIDVPLLVSSMLSVEQPKQVSGMLQGKEDVDLVNIAELIQDIIDVLTAGDEIEISGNEAFDAAPVASTNDTAAIASTEEPRKEGLSEGGVENNGNFIGYLVSVLNQLKDANSQIKEKNSQLNETNGPGFKLENPAIVADQLDPNQGRRAGEEPGRAVAAKADVVQAFTTGETTEDLEAPVFVVEVVKASKKIQAQEVSPKKNEMPQSAEDIPAIDDLNTPKDDLFITSTREKSTADSTGEPKKIVIRVVEAQQIEAENGRDSRIIPQNDPSRQNVHHAAESKNTVGNDFNAMMVDKIEKITEQFAGRNMNSDMLVRLRIDEKETLLVGFKEEGSRVTVELKTTNENILNILQTQKDDMTKNLEGKNIFVSIHVDLDQNGQGKQGKHNGRGDKGEEGQEEQDFNAFIEALA